MKKIFILSALISFTILTACNKQEMEDILVPADQETPSLPAKNKADHDFSSTVNNGEASFMINNEDQIINEGDVLLLANNSINAVSYQWDFGNGDTSTEANPTYKYKIHGNYTVTLTVTDTYGKTHQTSDEVLVLCLFGGGDHDR